MDQVAPRSAWQIDLLKTYIIGVLDHMKDQLVSEAQMVTEREKAKKAHGESHEESTTEESPKGRRVER